MIDLGSRCRAFCSALVLLLVLAMVGCQGVSAAKSSPQSSSPSSTSLAAQLSALSSSLIFRNVPLGSSQRQSATLTNSGGSTVTISQATVSGVGFSLDGSSFPLSLIVGQSTAFTVTFAPQATGNASGNLSIISNASDSTLNISLSGTGVTAGSLTPTSSSINFGTVQVGSNVSQNETLTNSGGSSVTISQATPSGSGFSVSGLNTPLTLNAGQSTTFSVIFTPGSAATATGNVSITSDGSNPSLAISLTGTGSTVPGQLAVTPNSINFGSVVMGASQSQSATLSANAAAVTVSSISGLNGSEFSVTGIAFPLTIPAGSTVSFTTTFTPQASGSGSANVTFTSNASNSPAILSLNGTGTTPVQHTVDLSWTASTSVVVGYNVYRGTQSGGPYSKLNSVLQASTNYTDSTVQSGQTYYYVTTAIDATSVESGYSNAAQAVIPSP